MLPSSSLFSISLVWRSCAVNSSKNVRPNPIRMPRQKPITWRCRTKDRTMTSHLHQNPQDGSSSFIRFLTSHLPQGPMGISPRLLDDHDSPSQIYTLYILEESGHSCHPMLCLLHRTILTTNMLLSFCIILRTAMNLGYTLRTIITTYRLCTLSEYHENEKKRPLSAIQSYGNREENQGVVVSILWCAQWDDIS